MISREALDKFLEDVRQQIAEIDKANKQNAEDTLNAVAKFYQQRVAERVAAEIEAADDCIKIGDEMGARHHKVLADIYKSLFNVHARQ
jgi:hypothetical protein